MNNLNYFFPYRSEHERENSLTRAYLSLLRLSPWCLAWFYDYMKQTIIDGRNGKETVTDLPSFYELPISEYDIRSQVGSIADEACSLLISILLTDQVITYSDTIRPVDRKAVYDGVIRFGNELLCIIENKPRNQNVWQGQLCPAAKDIDSEETLIVPHPAILQWSVIIKALGEALDYDALSGTEKHLIGDFLEFVNIQHAYLNPYDRLTLCKNNEELINRRLRQILESISTHPDHVNYHRGWSHYIKSDVPAIGQFALRQERGNEESKWDLRVCMVFGDTISQSRYFYPYLQSMDEISDMINKKWAVNGNFHLSFRSQGLLWFETPEDKVESYVAYWKETERIKQYDKSVGLRDLLDDLEAKSLILINEAKHRDLQNKIFDKNYKKLNVCPSLYLSYHIDREDACRLDDASELSKFVNKLMKEALSIIHTKSANLI